MGVVMNEQMTKDFIPNKTLLYLVPMLGHNFKYYGNAFYEASFIIEEGIIVITLFIDEVTESFDKLLRSRYNFTDILFQNEYYISYGFRIPDIHITNFYNFIDGKYSLIESEYKEFILNCHNYNSILYLKLKAVLFPTMEDRIKLMEDLGVNELPGGSNAEVGSIINLEIEEFNEQKLIR